MKYKCPTAYSFGRSKKCAYDKTDPLFNPGPGEYTSSFYNKSKEPSWKIGKELRSKNLNDDTPGPGQYDPSSPFKKAPKYSMRSKLNSSKSSCSPGPGQYDPSSPYKKAPKYSMRSKSNITNHEEKPGPWHYNIISEKSNQPAFKFGNEKRSRNGNEKDDELPGPGNYDILENKMMSKTQPKFSFGKESKEYINKNQTPGPGQYNYREYFGKESPKISIRKRIKVLDNKNVPGPGEYYKENAHLGKSASFKMGTSKRMMMEISEDIPGPGYYEVEEFTKKIKPKTPSCIIGKSKRMGLSSSVSCIAGVGDYNIRKELGSDAPKYSMKSKINVNDDNGVPGPGEYENASRSKINGFIIGKEARSQTLQEDIPGPGMYDHKGQLNGPKYGFGFEKKFKSFCITSPGPADYHIPCLIANVNDYTRESGVFDPNYRYI